MTIKLSIEGLFLDFQFIQYWIRFLRLDEDLLMDGSSDTSLLSCCGTNTWNPAIASVSTMLSIHVSAKLLHGLDPEQAIIGVNRSNIIRLGIEMWT